MLRWLPLRTTFVIAALAALVSPSATASSPTRGPSDRGARGASGADVVANAAQARGPYGRLDVALEVEVKPISNPFDGAGTVVSGWVDVGTAGAALTTQVSGLTFNTTMHWRARLRYRPTQALHP